MSHFYGYLHGTGATSSTRSGTKKTGITSQVGSYTTSTTVEITHNKDLGVDITTILTAEDMNQTPKRIMSYFYKGSKLVIVDTEYPELLI